jgi:hypothetical protein
VTRAFLRSEETFWFCWLQKLHLMTCKRISTFPPNDSRFVFHFSLGWYFFGEEGKSLKFSHHKKSRRTSLQHRQYRNAREQIVTMMWKIIKNSWSSQRHMVEVDGANYISLLLTLMEFCGSFFIPGKSISE